MVTADREFILKKTRELVNVLLRVAIVIRRSDLRSKLEKHSFDLLEAVLADDIERALAVVHILDGFIHLGRLIVSIEPLNAELLIHELSTLDSLIRQKYGYEKLPNLQSLFSTLPNYVDNLDKADVQSVEKMSEPSINDDYSEDNASKSFMRQSAILKRIRQNEELGCRMSDLMEEFPSVSERTLRYDLGSLVDQGLVVKIGVSGPGTTYVIK